MPEAQVIEMAHLMRRAGFGASRDELEGYLANGYEATVEEMLHPETQPPALEDEDLVTRYHAGANQPHAAAQRPGILAVPPDKHQAPS